MAEPAPDAAGVTHTWDEAVWCLAALAVAFQARHSVELTAAAQEVLAAFVEEMKASGFVAGALRRHHIQGGSVAPAA